MDPVALAALLASMALLGAIVAVSHGKGAPGFWALSWTFLISTGVLLALDPAPAFKEAARIGASVFPGLQLAGAYRYVGAAIPVWVLPITAVLVLARSGVALAGFHEASHVAVLPIEVALIGWSGRVVLAQERREAVDRLLAVGAVAICGVEILDAFYDLGKPDGTVIWAPWFLVGACVGVLQTVSVSERSQRAALEERRAREERERTAQRLESLGVLAGGIAHDFNNLLTAIIGNTELALLELDEDHPARTGIESATEGALAAAALSGQMLAYAAGEPLQPGPVDLAELLRARAALLRSAVRADVELSIDAPEDLPLVLADSTQLEQVILNLAINAGEACRDGAGVVRVSVEEVTFGDAPPTVAIGELRAGRYLRLAVQDDGSGLDPETASGIFDPFFTTKFAGRGMGLAVAQQIVRAHEGAIAVDSMRGQTRFDVYLPVDAALERTKSAPPAVPAEARGCVLIVDDDAAVLRVATRALLDAGHEVLAATGGREAVEILEDPAARPALVLLDATMPEVGALDVIACARTTRPGTPILMMTGHDTGRLASELVEPEIVGWVRKPFRLATLADRVAEALGRSESQSRRA